MNKINIMGTPCFQVDSDNSAINYIEELLKSNKGGYSTAINAEKIMMYSKDSEMKSIIDNSILPIPDGSGAVIGMKLLYGLNSIRLDLPKTVFELANKNKYKLFILGSTENINQKAAWKLKEKYIDINIAGRHNGFFDDKEEIIQLLKNINPQIVMVALGSPKQEKFAAAVSKVLPNILFIGCGGALDILAGKLKRAPKFFQNNHLEWLYRLILEPKRIKRQKILPVYFTKLIFETIKRKLKK